MNRPEEWGAAALEFFRALEEAQIEQVAQVLQGERRARWRSLAMLAKLESRSEAQQRAWETEGKEAVRDFFKWITEKK